MEKVCQDTAQWTAKVSFEAKKIYFWKEVKFLKEFYLDFSRYLNRYIFVYARTCVMCYMIKQEHEINNSKNIHSLLQDFWNSLEFLVQTWLSVIFAGH